MKCHREGTKKMYSVENFIVGFEKVLHNVRIEDRETHFAIIKIYERQGGGEKEEIEVGELDKEELLDCEKRYTEKSVFTGSCLYEGVTYEAAVKPQDRGRGMPYRYYERDAFKVSERGYEMIISKASIQYVYALLCFIGKDDKSVIDIDFFHINRSVRMNEIHKMRDLAEGMHILTAKIKAPIMHSQNELSKMMHTYLFNVAYNYEMVFIFTNFKDGFRRRFGTEREGQLFPYKAYNHELTTYYYQGVSTDIPFTQYLAFYHVAEYFFQTIAEQDAFEEIEAYITRPSFSPHKKEDIRAFYNRIKKKMREQKEDGLWEEKTGLLLCLKKYIKDLETLKDTITEIDPTAIAYYEKEQVSFASDGGTINFGDSQEAVYATIRNRVYAVRNAIVHSKEGEKLRYEPYKHDKELVKEIPLIRAIAEEIIINSAKRLEFIKFE